MRILPYVKEFEAASIGKRVREGVGRKRASKSEEKARDGVEAETRRKGWKEREREKRREEWWNEVALKLGQVYSVSMSPLIDHRQPPTTPCGSTYHRL